MGGREVREGGEGRGREKGGKDKRRGWNELGVVVSEK